MALQSAAPFLAPGGDPSAQQLRLGASPQPETPHHCRIPRLQALVDQGFPEEGRRPARLSAVLWEAAQARVKDSCATVRGCPRLPCHHFLHLFRPLLCELSPRADAGARTSKCLGEWNLGTKADAKAIATANASGNQLSAQGRPEGIEATAAIA
eukprot:scaffold2329_cov247-Pinguiococcus_pyrenoidosus.AAC.14